MTSAKVAKSVKVIHISGRRWFQRTYGNTYHAVSVYVDGEHVHTSVIAYGYGDGYQQTAQDWLEANGYLPDLEHHANGSTEPLWRYCEKRNIKLVCEVADVGRERDL